MQVRSTQLPEEVDEVMTPRRRSLSGLAIIFALLGALTPLQWAWPAGARPVPLVEAGKPVDWWFVFKFNSSNFAGCGPDSGARTCPFGGLPQPYHFSQQFVYASSTDGRLTQGEGCVGTTSTDPLGATFDQVYNGSFFYLIWNDQFYRDPKLKICGNSNACAGRWGHSKGMLAWNDDGDGFVMQVTTPSWPGSGSKRFKRRSGNTLGCVKTNNVKYSQHFFALRLGKSDLVKVLKALQNASVVTETTNAQITRNGGPPDVRALVDELGKKSASEQFLKAELSTGVTVISKPSRLTVPPWQLVSSLLGSAAERTTT
jgi:hypothetical protein